MIDSTYEEECLLGSLFADNALLEDIQRTVSPEHFSAPSRRAIFAASVKIIGDGGRADAYSVGAAVPPQAENAYRLAGLMPTGANWKYYAEKVRDAGFKRKLSQVAEDITKLCQNGDAAEMIRSQAEERIFALSNEDAADYLPLATVGMNVLPRIQERIDHKGELEGIASGFGRLDALVGGFRAGELITIGARPSIGKTAFALTLAFHIAETVPVGFLSLEMSADQIGMRAFSMLGNVDTTRMQTGNMQISDAARLMSAGKRFLSTRFFLYDKPSMTVPEIISASRRLVSREKAQMIFIDYGGLVSLDGENRAEAVSGMVRAIKGLARELQKPIALLAQVNRGSEGRNPTLADLKESGGYEEHSDVVIFLHRDRIKDGSNVETLVTVAKNRQGATGETKLAFVPRFTKFAELT